MRIVMEMLDIRTPVRLQVLLKTEVKYIVMEIYMEHHIYGLLEKKIITNLIFYYKKGLQQRILMQAVTIYLLQVILLPVRAIWKQL
jgi:hypothetical protein